MRTDAKSHSDWAGLPLIATIARLLCRELTLQNEYLRQENKVLRSKIKGRIRFDDEERRSLVSAAVAMGNKLMRQVVTIVKPETILKWQRQLERQKWDYSKRPRRPGRPRKLGEIEAIVCRMARENTWGYGRIQGELAKLGIAISESCVADILRRNGLPPSPERGGLTWREFLDRHADVMLCADFFTKEVWTLSGLQRAFVLFVMHMRTRTILLTEATFSPHSRWMEQQVRNLMWECEDRGIQPRFLIHDRDGCFSAEFDTVLKHCGVEAVKTPFHAPNANAHAERWVRSARDECLNHLILFGLDSLRRTVRSYKDFFNEQRPHQGIGNRIPAAKEDQTASEMNTGDRPVGKVQCNQWLGGLLKSYRRAA
ncbi:MAG: integrase core domain-containing protein [Candidatus Methylomirabilota bacterium]